MRNGCGGKGGFKFSTLKNWIASIPFFVNKDKLNNLYSRIEEEVCNPHDDDFERGGNMVDFFKANWKFAKNINSLLYWAKGFRWIVSLICFIGLTIFGGKYFNWK